MANMYPAMAPPMWDNSPPAFSALICMMLTATLMSAIHLILTSPNMNRRTVWFGARAAIAIVIAMTAADAPKSWENKTWFSKRGKRL